MKKPKIFFSPIAGSSILSITWFPGPQGDAVEANNGFGVGFFGHNGDLLSVQFDDVNEKGDHQILDFDTCSVEVTLKNRKISFNLIRKNAVKSKIKKSKSFQSRNAA